MATRIGMPLPPRRERLCWWVPRGSPRRLLPHTIDPSGNVLALQLDCEERTKARCSSGAWSVVKLDRGSGNQLWAVPELPGVGGAGDIPISVKADPAGDVLVLGLASNQHGNGEWVVFKLDGQTGELVWGPVRMGLTFSSNSSPALLLPSTDGGVYVVGHVYAESRCLLAVARLDSTTGQQVWGPGPVGNGFARFDPVQISLDPAGDLLVLERGGLLVKLSKADGQVLWAAPPQVENKHTYRRSAPSIVVDGQGDIWLLGWGAVNRHLHPVWGATKHNGRTGAVLAQHRAELDENEIETSPGPAFISRQGRLVVTLWIQKPYVTSEPSYEIAVSNLDATSGDTVWGPIRAEVGSSGWEKPLAVETPEGDIVVGDLGGVNITRVSVADGSVRWGPIGHEQLGLGDWRLRSLHVLDAGHLVLVGHDGEPPVMLPSLLALDAGSGEKRWGPVALPEQFRGEYPLRGSATNADGLVLLAVFQQQGNLARPHDAMGQSNEEERAEPPGRLEAFAFDGSTGALRWGPRPFSDTDWNVSAWFRLASDPSGDFVATMGGQPGGGHVVKLSGAHGDLVWRGPFILAGAQESGSLWARDDDVVVTLPKAAEHFLQRLTPGLTLDLAGGWLPPAQSGVPYAFDLPARNGEPPLRFRLASGALPRGVKLDRRSGTIAGTSTEEGAWYFDVEVTDSQRITIRRSLSLDVFSEAAVLRGAPSPTARVIPFELYSPLRCSDVPSSVP